MRKFIVLLACLLLFSCQDTGEEGKIKNLSLPDEGKVLLFIGQDLEAIGGLEDYDEGYIDYFGMPAGITTYTGISDMDGLNRFTNYGAGDVHAKAYLDNDRFNETMMAIGLYMVDDLERTLLGEYDHHLDELAEFIKTYDNSVFLRIGYEFNNGGNHYDPDTYIAAYQYVCDYLNQASVSNFISVWQADERGTSEELIKWYPGDDYVDWMAYSYFNQDPAIIGQGILELAKEHDKPVMIAEVTPRVDIYLEDNFVMWHTWYQDFLNHVKDNKDLIKAVSYINCRWRTQEMWQGQGWGDSRLQLTEYYRDHWLEELESGLWQFQSLNSHKTTYTMTEKDDYPSGTLMPGESVMGAFEAENGQALGNVIQYEDPYASGQKGMAYIYEPGDRIIFSDLPQSSKILLRYASNVEEAAEGENQTGKIGLYVDGVRVQDIIFKGTGSWVESYEIIEISVDIKENSSLAIGFEEGDTAMNVDCIVPKE